MSRGKLKEIKKRKPKVDTRGLLPRKKKKVMSLEAIREELRKKKLREKNRKEFYSVVGKGRA